MMKIYLAGPMFDEADVMYNLHIAKTLRENGFEVYCPNENMSINDKTRSDITPERIYQEDRDILMGCNVLLCRLSYDPGSMWEAGFMDCLTQLHPEKYYGCIGLTTDSRWNTPYNPDLKRADSQCYYFNGFVIGGLNLSLGVQYSIVSVIQRLKALCKQNEGYIITHVD